MKGIGRSGEAVIEVEGVTKVYSVTGQEVMALLSNLHARGHTIILVTHDAEVARYAQRTLWMQDGRLREA